MVKVAKHGKTFEAFRITFAALSFVFTVAATEGDYWLTVEDYGEETEEIGLWQECKERDEYKQCIKIDSVGINNLSLTVA